LTLTTAVKIDPATGIITTARENPFDFETQQQIIFQVSATDSDGKRAIAQVTLSVTDENDTPPTISLVRRTKNVISFINNNYAIYITAQQSTESA
jgi:hypothetical protein